MKWFGKKWPSLICKSFEQTDIPNKLCAWCGEEFLGDDSGLLLDCGTPYHKVCFMREVVGSIEHQKKLCSCYGGKEQHSGTSKAEAQAAVDYFVESLKCS